MPSVEGIIFGNENFGFGLMSKIRLPLFIVLYCSLAEKKLSLISFSFDFNDLLIYIFNHQAGGGGLYFFENCIQGFRLENLLTR